MTTWIEANGAWIVYSQAFVQPEKRVIYSRVTILQWQGEIFFSSFVRPRLKNCSCNTFSRWIYCTALHFLHRGALAAFCDSRSRPCCWGIHEVFVCWSLGLEHWGGGEHWGPQLGLHDCSWSVAKINAHLGFFYSSKTAMKRPAEVYSIKPLLSFLAFLLSSLTLGTWNSTFLFFNVVLYNEIHSFIKPLY